MSVNAPIVTVVCVGKAPVLVSVAVTTACVPVVFAVKTQKLVFVQVLGTLPSPVADQLAGAFAFKVKASPNAKLELAGVMASGIIEIFAVPVAPEPSVAVAVTVPDPVVLAAVKVLPLNEPRLESTE